MFFRYSSYCCYILQQIARLSSKILDNKFFLCQIDTLRYELKHCPITNESMREEYKKYSEKLRTIIGTEKEKNQNVFYEWEKKRFGHG